jgi:predicted secreted protein
MRYNFNTLFILSSLPLLFFSCSTNFIKKEAPQVNEVSLGSDFTINLPENHNDGYTWQMSDIGQSHLIEIKTVVWHGNEKGIYFNFKALNKGQLELRFIKRKYVDTAFVKCFIVKINGN